MKQAVNAPAASTTTTSTAPTTAAAATTTTTGATTTAAATTATALFAGAPGFCGVTGRKEGLRCASRDAKGSWPAVDLRQCLEWCDACQQCRFVSFSKADFDCSWFRECGVLQTKQVGWQGWQTHTAGHVTWQVRHADGTATPAVDFLRSGDRRRSRPLSPTQVLDTHKWLRLHARDSFLVQVGANAHRDTACTPLPAPSHLRSLTALRLAADSNDDPGPRAVALGWRALLLEPMPRVFASLRSTYPKAAVVTPDAEAGSSTRVSLVQAAVCDARCRQQRMTLFSVDFANASNFGSLDADGRCMTLGDAAWDKVKGGFGWYTEVASASKSYILGLPPRKGRTPNLCRACGKALGLVLPPTCASRVIEANLVASDVPCVCMRRAVLHHASRRHGRPFVTLLLVDTEGCEPRPFHPAPLTIPLPWQARRGCA